MGNKAWYVLYTKPRNEKKVTHRLSGRHYEVYCPLIETVKQWSDRRKKVKIPLFNSYVFIKLEEREREEVLRDPGVLNFVFWLGRPAIVRDTEIDAIRYITLEAQEVEVSSIQHNEGDEVLIKEGTFKGLRGIVDMVDKNQVTLYIDALQCKIQFKHSRRFLEKQEINDR